MGKHWKDPDQDQAQGNLQGQLQGQANLQGQGQDQDQDQSQYANQAAVQGLWSGSENYNGNGNGNEYSNDNKLDNSVDNKIENNVETKVDVDVKVDLDLDASSFANPVIDLSGIHGIEDSLIMSDVVNQTLNGGGNMFNIDRVNNLADNDHLSNPQVNFNGADGGGYDWCDPADGTAFNMEAHVNGAQITANGAMGGLDHGSTGVSADTVVDQSAFNQTITMGANIQFNSQTITAGEDFHDSHDIG